MFKKILSLALVAMMLMSVCAVSFSAAQVEVSADGAESAIAEQGADGDVASQGAESDAASTSAGNSVTFDANSAGWSGVKNIGFYVWEVGAGELLPWGSKKLNGTDNGDGTFTKDMTDYNLEAGKQYGIIFVNGDTSAQTYNLMMDTSCLGDTAVADPSTSYENPEDSNKTCMKATWKNSSLGPQLCVSSIGTVQGTTCPNTTTPYQLLVDFLKNTLDNARTYSKKDDQTLLDDTAKGLGVGKNDLEKAIAEANVTVDWSKDKSSLSEESDASANQAGGSSGGGSGSDSGSGSGSGSGSDSSSSKSTSGSGSGSTSGGNSSSSKSGSASNTQTGQTETVLFIMLGVMVAAAGVIFFARKKERT